MDSRDRTLLIHLEGSDLDARQGGSPGGSLAEVYDRHVLPWYCQWAQEFAQNVYVLLPKRFEDEAKQVLSHLGDASVIWYGNDGIRSLPLNGRKGDVWVVNGHQLPMVDWRAADAATHRRRTDVMIFGQKGVGVTNHYPESVVVESSGEVVRFKRHYSDSPTFTDVCADEASFLTASTDHAQSVVNHIIARGWGLDSIGAMTRRFLVRWSPTGCVLWEAAVPGSVGSISGDSIRHRQMDSNSLAPLDEDHPYSFPRRTSHAPDHREADLGGDTGELCPDTIPFEPNRASASIDKGSTGRGDNRRSASPRLDGTDTDGRTLSPTLLQFVSTSAVDNATRNDKRAYLLWKRVMDVTLTLISLIALSPLLILVAILVKSTSRGPVFFAHRRQGVGGREFPCIKFRSMLTGADAMQDALRAKNEVDGPQFKIARDPRLTTIGHWLRRTNIDELPQLFNVLVGHMSLVGPRPSPDKENQLCPSWRRARLSVKPGVTGLWQVMRRRDEEASDFQEWIYYDVEYVRHRSLWLDWQIILYTPVSILAPTWVKDFAKQLRRHGICTYSAWLEEPTVHHRDERSLATA